MSIKDIFTKAKITPSFILYSIVSFFHLFNVIFMYATFGFIFKTQTLVFLLVICSLYILSLSFALDFVKNKYWKTRWMAWLFLIGGIFLSLTIYPYINIYIFVFKLILQLHMVVIALYVVIKTMKDL